MVDFARWRGAPLAGGAVWREASSRNCRPCCARSACSVPSSRVVRSRGRNQRTVPVRSVRTITGRCPSGPVSPDGARVFQTSCATCHTGAAESRAPSLDALRTHAPQAIIDSLLTGAMRPQGSRLSGPERRAVAEFITGKTLEGDVSGALTGRCTSSGPLQDFAAAAMGWLESIDYEHGFSLRTRRVSTSVICAD